MRAFAPKALAAAAIAAVIGGCSFVEVQPNASDILVLEPERTENCKRLGETRVSVAAKVGFIKRGEPSVRSDLEKLAKNSAADMGGDTITPESGIKAGKQTYGVFDCVE